MEILVLLWLSCCLHGEPAKPDRIDTPEKAREAQAAWARKLRQPVQWTNTIGMKFQLIPPGEFLMGSPDGDADAKPRWVTLTQPFNLGTYEVTRSQFKAVTNLEHSTYFPGPDMPINFITYDQAADFIAALNKKEKLDSNEGYRLPYEAEWEYAARAGAPTHFPTGNSEKDLDKSGWYYGNSGDTTHPVGRKSPNAFGLYDMHGNIWEWCQDWYDPDYYRYGSPTDPKGPARTLYWYRVLRGGSVYYGAKACRSCNRGFYQDSRSERTIGFRILIPLSPGRVGS